MNDFQGKERDVLQGGQQFAESILKTERMSHKDLSKAKVKGSTEFLSGIQN